VFTAPLRTIVLFILSAFWHVDELPISLTKESDWDEKTHSGCEEPVLRVRWRRTPGFFRFDSGANCRCKMAHPGSTNSSPGERKARLCLEKKSAKLPARES
jgi:hypothetical protein